MERCTRQHHAGGARHQTLLRPTSATTVLVKDASYWAAWLHHHGGSIRKTPPWAHAAPRWYSQATGTFCAPLWARAAPHSVRDNARAPPWRGADPPCRCAGHDDAFSHVGGASTAPRSGAAWRARVSLATPWWCNPRHGGAVTPPVGQPPPAPLCLQCLSQLTLAQSMLRCCSVGGVQCSRTHSLLSKGARMYTTPRVSYGYTTCSRCS